MESRTLQKKTAGYSLIEMLIYIAILVLIFFVIVHIFQALLRSDRMVRATKNIETSAVVALDRMVREIRDANGIDPLSVLGGHPGSLVLDTTDVSGNDRTVEFYLDSGVLYMRENGTNVGPLTLSGAQVTNLVFRQISSGDIVAVKIEMTIQSAAGSYADSENYYATAVLRDSY